MRITLKKEWLATAVNPKREAVKAKDSLMKRQRKMVAIPAGTYNIRRITNPVGKKADEDKPNGHWLILDPTPEGLPTGYVVGWLEAGIRSFEEDMDDWQVVIQG